MATTDDNINSNQRDDATKGYTMAQAKVGGQKIDFVANADIVKFFEEQYTNKIDLSKVANEDELEKAITRARERAAQSAYAYEENLFNKASIEEKKKLLAIRQAVHDKAIADKEKELQIELAKHKSNSKIYKETEKELSALREKADKAHADTLRKTQKLTREATDRDIKAKMDASKSLAKYDRKAYSESLGSTITTYRQLEKDALASGDKEAAKAYKQAGDNAAWEKASNDALIGAVNGVIKAVQNVQAALDGSVRMAMQDITKYMPIFSTRLQGSGKNFDSINKLVRNTLGVSPFIKQQTYLENISKGVQQGIAYNIESRAYLESIKDRVADTFNAFDATMSRMIRLQQSDSSMARLGMEASMTKTLNAMFSDTSYMTNVYDTVSGALLDASAQLSREESVEFEYTVQKWLGSLYSLGLSDAFVGQVAQGINYLGTGNVQALAGNSALQTLMAMSASRAGIPYGETLIGGLNASTTNKLLQSMVEYLQEIAGDTNKVVKSAYGDIFGFSQSDLRAIGNLTPDEINALAGGNLSYKGAMKELQAQILQVVNRTSLAQMVDTLFANAVYTMGMGVASNPATYVLWKVADMIEGATGGIHLPAISVMGNMVDLSSFTIEGIMKTGIVGLGSLSLIPAILGSFASGGGLNPMAFGFQEHTSRGSGMGILPGNDFTQGVSSSGYVGSGSGEDAKKASLTSATEEAGETAEITNAGMGTDHDFDDLYTALFIEPIPIEVKVAKEVETRFENLIKEILTSIGTNSVLSIMKENAEEKGIPVMVINTETPVKAEVANQTIVDYYLNQSTALPGVGLGLGLAGFP